MRFPRVCLICSTCKIKHASNKCHDDRSGQLLHQQHVECELKRLAHYELHLRYALFLGIWVWAAFGAFFVARRISLVLFLIFFGAPVIAASGFAEFYIAPLIAIGFICVRAKDLLTGGSDNTLIKSQNGDEPPHGTH